MMHEDSLRQKLRKIEALFAKTTNEGEHGAAKAAMLRIKEQLEQNRKRTGVIECKFSLNNRWSRQLFVALCRRYGLKPYRYYRQRNTTMMLKAPQEFIDKVLYPEFIALDEELRKYFDEQVEAIIKEEIYNDVTDAEEVDSQNSSAKALLCD